MCSSDQRSMCAGLLASYLCFQYIRFFLFISVFSLNFVQRFSCRQCNNLSNTLMILLSISCLLLTCPIKKTYMSYLKKTIFTSRVLLYNPIFDSQIYQNTAESLILPGFFSGVFSFYYIVFFLNQIWMIDFYDFSRDCLLSFWISFIFLLVRNS